MELGWGVPTANTPDIVTGETQARASSTLQELATPALGIFPLVFQALSMEVHPEETGREGHSIDPLGDSAEMSCWDSR